VITVNWRHIILDPVVYTRYGSHRVARVNRSSGIAGGAFPAIRMATWSDGGSTWSPNTEEKGEAPEGYSYMGNHFLFGFWSVLVRSSVAPISGTTGRVVLSMVFAHREMPPVIDFPFPVTVEATAWYVWDLGGGVGPHAAYLDAFDLTACEFIADEFVDVVPDRSLTPEANDGLLSTENIVEEMVVARDPTGDVQPPSYNFQNWQVMANLVFSASGSTEPPPSIDGRRITLHRGSIIDAVAFYARPGAGTGTSIPPIEKHYPFWTVTLNDDDGVPFTLIFIGPRPPFPPWDMTVLKELTLNIQKIAQDLSGKFQK
jgi:hypothetical protein